MVEPLKENFEYITNYKKATVCDLESDGLLDTITKIHIIGYKLYNSEEVGWLFGDDDLGRIHKMLDYHIDNKIPMVFHNGVGFDKRAMEMVLERDLSELQIIDTLWLSYYLNINLKSHSIEALSSQYDVGDKFEVDPEDWKDLPKDVAIKRVTSDVEIGTAVWEDFRSRLEEMYTLAKDEIDSGNVGGSRMYPDEETFIDKLKGRDVEWHVARILGYITAIAEVVSVQERVGWEVDIDNLTEHLTKLEALADSSAKELESVMPKVPKYVKRKEPKEPYLKSGQLSATGKRWHEYKKLLKGEAKDELGNPLAFVKKAGEIEVLNGYTPPNINSHVQVKQFLFDNGWIPQTFEYKRDNEAFQEWIDRKPPKGSPRGSWTEWNNSKPKDREIPQIKDGDELCRSITELAEKVPEIKVLEEYSVITHRISVLKGMLESVRSDGKVEASAHGLTSTLRLMHRKPIVNLPSADSLHGQGIRSSLIAGEGNISIGSDLSSLINNSDIV